MDENVHRCREMEFLLCVFCLLTKVVDEVLC